MPPAPDQLPAADEVPVPELPSEADATAPALPDEATGIPLPEKKPNEPPLPEANPDKPQLPDAVEPPPAEPPVPPDPRSALRPDPSGKMPPEELACRQRLTALGVKFENHAAESDPAGCSIPYPLTVKSLGADIGLQPDAEMNCAMAEAAARFAKDVVSPAAQSEFGQPLKSVSHASAYVCRPRNGTRKLSEHAFGNALDIAAFTLADGTTVAVELRPTEKPAIFLGKLRKAACGPFKTVLGPGSDADHALHFHLDLAPRRHGGTVCE